MQNQFCESADVLTGVMLNHAGVLCYHADYPEPNLSEWMEIYANDDTFASTSMTLQPASLSELINYCSKVSCRCWGDQLQRTSQGLAAEYQSTGKGAFVLNQRRSSLQDQGLNQRQR